MDTKRLQLVDAILSARKGLDVPWFVPRRATAPRPFTCIFATLDTVMANVPARTMKHRHCPLLSILWYIKGRAVVRNRRKYLDARRVQQ